MTIPFLGLKAINLRHPIEPTAQARVRPVKFTQQR